MSAAPALSAVPAAAPAPPALPVRPPFAAVADALAHLSWGPDPLDGYAGRDESLIRGWIPAERLTLAGGGVFIVGPVRSGWMVWHARTALDMGRRLHKSRRAAAAYADRLAALQCADGSLFPWDAPGLGPRIAGFADVVRQLWSGPVLRPGTKLPPRPVRGDERDHLDAGTLVHYFGDRPDRHGMYRVVSGCDCLPQTGPYPCAGRYIIASVAHPERKLAHVDGAALTVHD